MKKKIKDLIPYIVIFIVVVLIRSFIITPVVVVGDSMVPTLKNKQILLLNKVSYNFSNINRFDIVVIKLGKQEIIKRVIGLPGETVEYKGNTLYINGKELKNNYDFETEDFDLDDVCKCRVIPKDKYLVLGDNRSISADSRWYGLIDSDNILGKTNISIWPIKKIEK